MPGFTFKYNQYGLPEVFRDYIIANSNTQTVGDMTNLVSGFLEIAASTERLLGVVEGFVTSEGVPLDKLTAGTDYDGTYTAGGTNVGQYVASADNQTDKRIRGRVRVTLGDVYSNTPDAAIATTVGSDLAGNYTDLVDEDAVDENNAGNAFTTMAQLMIHGVDPELTSAGLYSIAERQDMS